MYHAHKIVFNAKNRINVKFAHKDIFSTNQNYVNNAILCIVSNVKKVIFVIYVNQNIIGMAMCLEPNASDVHMDVINVISSLAKLVWRDFTKRMVTVTGVMLHVFHVLRGQYIVMFVCLDSLRLKLIGADV